MPEPLIEVRNLRVQFRSDHSLVEAVKGVSFPIMPGQNLAIVGESGSGKSVTALSLLRLHDETRVTYPEGEIHFDGKDLLQTDEAHMRAIRGRDMSMIFQEPMTSLNPLYPVGDQIIEPLLLHQGLSRQQAITQAMELMHRVGIPDPRARMQSFPHMLSGGQRQRVMIAMALACRPRLLIADEPTTALDVTIQKQILELLNDLQQEFGMSVLMISHDLNLVRHYSEYVCVMNQGLIVEQGRVADIFASPQHDYTRKLLEAQPSRLIQAHAGDTETLLKASDIRVYFPVTRGFFKRKVDEIRAVDHISLELKQGETLGIVGESGSGKTTLGMALLRLEKARGEIHFDGRDLHRLSQSQVRPLRKEFQVVFQDPYSSLSPRMTVEQIIGEGLELHYPELSRLQRREKIIAILNEVGLEEDAIWRYPHEFSGGQRQRIAIARVVVLEPKLVLLDEPTSALDVSVQKQVLELLVSLQKKHNLSYLFISHDLKVVRAISHRVLVMQAGQLVEAGETEQMFNRPAQEYTRQLLSAALFEAGDAA